MFAANLSFSLLSETKDITELGKYMEQLKTIKILNHSTSLKLPTNLVILFFGLRALDSSIFIGGSRNGKTKQAR